MIKISEDVYFIEGRDDMIPDSHVYIIGNPESNDLSMVDVGLMGKAAYKIKAIEDMGLKLEDIKRIIMTHTHLDHIGCLSEMQGESLSRLGQLKVNILLPGHNRIIQEVPEGYIRDTAEQWRSYLQ